METFIVKVVFLAMRHPVQWYKVFTNIISNHVPCNRTMCLKYTTTTTTFGKKPLVFWKNYSSLQRTINILYFWKKPLVFWKNYSCLQRTINILYFLKKPEVFWKNYLVYREWKMFCTFGKKPLVFWKNYFSLQRTINILYF